MMPATIRSGQTVAVPQTAKAAIMTMTLPIASLRQHNHTDRTLASPSILSVLIPSGSFLNLSSD